jgi:predicted ATPase
MKLIVKNYGPIREGSVDLSKKLYIFVGYNNTGKTCLTKLMYEIFNPETLSDFSNSNYNDFKYENSTTLQLTEKLIDKVLENYAIYLRKEVVRKILKLDESNDVLIEFKYAIADVEEKGLKSGARVGVSDTDSDTDIEIYSLNKAKGSLDITFEHWSFDDIQSKLPSDFFDNVPKKKFENRINSVRSDISKTLVHSLLNLLLQNKEKPCFLPSNRASILEYVEEFKKKEESRNKEFSELLVNMLESKKQPSQLQLMLAKKMESEYPSYIERLINEIIKLRNSTDDGFLRTGIGLYDDFLLKFSQILGGEIVFEKNSSISNYTEKLKMQDGNHIRMDLASSSVNQLSLLFLFLKYWAKQESNFLMIDEPEQNLHPENQRLLIDLLLKFCSENNRLLITTHSPLVAEMVNNYLVLAQLNDDSKAQLADEEYLVPDINISPSDSAVYFFKGDDIIEHKIEDYGTSFTSFKEAQDVIYGSAAKLGDFMFEQISRK